MSPPDAAITHVPAPHARRGLVAVFGSTLFLLSGIFMLSPLTLLMLKRAEVSTTLAGLFAATTWLGTLVMTPFASRLARAVGRHRTMWLASTMPLLAALGFMLSSNLWLLFALQLLAGIANSLRWVLAEAFIAEFAPRGQTGRYIGSFATLVGLTVVIGPALLAWVGADNTQAFSYVLCLLVLGLALTALIPHLPSAHDSHSTHIGWRGLWQGLNAHRVVVLAGFVGGFFDLGLDSTLPLYGLTLGLNDDASALLVAVSGAGGTLMALPAGMLADRFADPAQGRRAMMTALAGLILLATLACPLVTQHTALVWPIVAIWGTAGSTLYTLVMVDIGATEKGLSLVNSTSVLVLAYTLGSLMAASLTGVLLDWSPRLGFPLLLVGVATIGLMAMRKTRGGVQSAA